jgi:hypothetical protein
MIGGAIMLLTGLAALVPAWKGAMDTLPPLALEISYGLFLGFLPMNIVNKLLLIVVGAAGLYASRAKFRDLPASIGWSRMVFFLFGAAAILGMIPATNTFFGYAPLFGNYVWVHAVFAIAGAYFGYALSSRVPDSGPARKDFTTPIHGTR